MTHWTLDQVKRAIEGGVKPLIICGAGTTTYATDGAAPTWRSLIQSGVKRALDRNAKEQAWSAYASERLLTNNVKDWLAVADEVMPRLGGHDGVEMSIWLKEQLANLEIKKSDLYEAIFRLNCPVATTNYDTLLTKFSGRSAVSWANSDLAAKIIRGDDDSILHLHGIYSLPESVILGQTSYNAISANHNNNLVRTFQSIANPTIFIGCGWDGISDSDFTNIGDLISGISSAEQRRFWFVKNGVAEASQNTSNNLLIVEYGENYSDLPGFIDGLLQNNNVQSPACNTKELTTNIEFIEPKPIIFGRENQLQTIVSSLLSDGHALISGAPGIGKTALAVTCLYHDQVVEKFGYFRFFVSLEKQAEPHAILSATALVLGLTVNGDDASLLRQISLFAKENPFVIIYDNAEDAFEEHFLECEKVLRLISQINGVSVILTTRDMLPLINNSVSFDVLDKLDPEASKDTFLAMSGQKRTGEEGALNTLLEALDGHPLSLHLIAAQSRKFRDLTELLAGWEQQKALLLKRRGQGEGRLTSVRASLATSFASKKLTGDPLARRLLNILSELPDGLNENECRSLLSDKSIVSKVRALEAINILRDLNLVENRPNGSIRMLNPLRESIKLDHCLSAKDKNAIVSKYQKGILAFSVMNPSSDAFDNLDSRHMNAESACRLAVDCWPLSKPLYELIASYTVYLSLSGRAIDPTWEQLAKRFAQSGEFVFGVSLLTRLGTIEFSRGNSARAKALYHRALPYTRQMKVSNTVGNLYRGLATCARHNGEVVESERLYKLAISVAGQVIPIDHVGLGNSYAGLGHLAFMAGDAGTAIQMFTDAIEHCESSKDVVGMANAISHLAKATRVAEAESHNRALDLIKDHNFNASESAVLVALGDHYFRAGDATQSENAYERAKVAARMGAHVMNEANAQIRLGQTLMAAGRHNTGVNEIVEGFELWFSTSASENSTMEGFLHIKEALLSSSPMIAFSHFSKALESWKRIGRNDLIVDWIEFKFGSSAINEHA